jgi:hypothetical protein
LGSRKAGFGGKRDKEMFWHEGVFVSFGAGKYVNMFMCKDAPG